MIITIDGSSGTGKTTVAKLLAEKLHITFFDTGAMYRALAYHIMKKGIDIHNELEVAKALSSFNFDIDASGSQKQYFVNTENVTDLIRSLEVTAASSIVSAHKKVRAHLLEIQRDFVKMQDAVFEGRDLGSIVFPNADYKFFLYAAPEIRATRRLKELKEKDPLHAHEYTFEAVLASIIERDDRDSTRAIAPLICPEGACKIDTSNQGVMDVVNHILAYIKRK